MYYKIGYIYIFFRKNDVFCDSCDVKCQNSYGT